MNDRIATEYSYKNNNAYMCNEYVRDMILSQYGSEVYNMIFEGKYEDTNTMFESFKNNPNLEWLNPFELERGIQEIQDMANNGTLILMIYQNTILNENGGRLSGHIAFIGNSNMTLSTVQSIPGLEGTRRTRMINDELIVVQAGTYTGITSIRYGTNGWGDTPKERENLLKDDLYFYRLRSYP